ncbi:MAG: hypothetical protein Sapg2KO_39160 [Saprospiraceae bacterium]
MRLSKFCFFLLAVFLLSSCEVKDVQSNSMPVKHDDWDALVKQHVNEAGWVDYKGFMADSTKLQNYLDLLRSSHPNKKNWSRNEQLAYWINAYNAFTVKLILDYYPVESIKDIKSGIPFVSSVWDIEFIEIEDQIYSLNNIEHGIIRPKFNEERIHFAVNCASYSCPKLLNEAFCAEHLDQQLDKVTKSFINNPEKNNIKEDRVEISKLLSWYWGDFKKKYNSRIEFINKYSATQVNEDAEVDYLEYIWALNEQKN